MMFERNQHLAMAHVIAPGVNHNAVPKHDVHPRMGGKKIADRAERARQILFIAIQIGEYVAGGAAEASIDRVIHAAVLFNERLHARVARQPVLCAVVGTGILHDVFPFDALLVGDGRDAQFQTA